MTKKKSAITPEGKETAKAIENSEGILDKKRDEYNSVPCETGLSRYNYVLSYTQEMTDESHSKEGHLCLDTDTEIDFQNGEIQGLSSPQKEVVKKAETALGSDDAIKKTLNNWAIYGLRGPIQTNLP